MAIKVVFPENASSITVAGLYQYNLGTHNKIINSESVRCGAKKQKFFTFSGEVKASRAAIIE